MQLGLARLGSLARPVRAFMGRPLLTGQPRSSPLPAAYAMVLATPNSFSFSSGPFSLTRGPLYTLFSLPRWQTFQILASR